MYIQNLISKYLNKSPNEFTKADLIKFIEDNNIQMVNFRYIGGDNKLKTLNFIPTDKKYLDRILTFGERVDGSSLFPYIDAGNSDLYVIPRYKTAFVNPFSSIPAIDILCSYYTKEGEPFWGSPENILRRAKQIFNATTGYSIETLGELEYYVFYTNKDLYVIRDQKGYHESSPFSKGEELRIEIMKAIAEVGGKIKYGHCEVGNILHNAQYLEQHEIEFLPQDIEECADIINISKWIIRNIAYKYGLTVSFAPKILVGHAGSGLHIHLKITKDNKNLLVQNNTLSDLAKKAIAGILNLSQSLTAFGNTVPTSYLRLVPHQEAPTRICWGAKNRSVLIRVPLGWLNTKNMTKDLNPLEKEETLDTSDYQTIEFRSPDGSANIYHLLAGITIAIMYGLNMPNAIDFANSLYVDTNIFYNKELYYKLPQLPSSCHESAQQLLIDRNIYQENNIFPPFVIEGIVNKLLSYNDKNLSERLYGRDDKIIELVNKYIHC